MSIERVGFFCKCGAGMEGDLDSRGRETFAKAWYSVHSGEGHGDCSASEAVLAYAQRNGGALPDRGSDQICERLKEVGR